MSHSPHFRLRARSALLAFVTMLMAMMLASGVAYAHHKPGHDQGPPDQAQGEPHQKITICHATGSETNPYVQITVNVNGLNGHGGHAGDIIPAPAGGCPTGDTAPGGGGGTTPGGGGGTTPGGAGGTAPGGGGGGTPGAADTGGGGGGGTATAGASQGPAATGGGGGTATAGVADAPQGAAAAGVAAGEQLPFTGVETWIAGILGTVMLVLGAALHMHGARRRRRFAPALR